MKRAFAEKPGAKVMTLPPAGFTLSGAAVGQVSRGPGPDDPEVSSLQAALSLCRSVYAAVYLSSLSPPTLSSLSSLSSPPRSVSPLVPASSLCFLVKDNL